MHESSMQLHCLIVLLQVIEVVLDISSGVVCFLSGIVVALVSCSQYAYVAPVISVLILLFFGVRLVGLDCEYFG
jgi:hypothetical protein